MIYRSISTRPSSVCFTLFINVCTTCSPNWPWLEIIISAKQKQSMRSRIIMVTTESELMLKRFHSITSAGNHQTQLFLKNSQLALF